MQSLEARIRDFPFCQSGLEYPKPDQLECLTQGSLHKLCLDWLQEELSSSYLQKTVSIAESNEEVVLPEEDVTKPTAMDKVLSHSPSAASNGSSRHGTSQAGNRSEGEGTAVLPSFKPHMQQRDPEGGPEQRPAFQTMDQHEDSKN